MGNFPWKKYVEGMVFNPQKIPSYNENYPRDVIFVDTFRKRKIAMYYQPAKKETKRTVIFSHGRSFDIGRMSWFMDLLHKHIPSANFVMYDPPQYGLSEGLLTEKSTYESLHSVVRYLIKEKKVPLKDIYLFGYSLGTGQSTHFGSMYPTGGIILQAPFTTCLSVIIKNKILQYFVRFTDVFQNISKIKNTSSRMAIFHGLNDSVIPFSHSQRLWNKIPKKYKLKFILVDGANHADIHEVLGEKYYNEISDFLDKCEKEREMEEQESYLQMKLKKMWEYYENKIVNPRTYKLSIFSCTPDFMEYQESFKVYDI